MKKVIKKLDFVTILLVIILLLAIYGIIQLKVFGKRYVNYFGYTAFQVITGSMQPTIRIKDVVFDRGGFIYHGVIKELADAAREAGLNF